MLKRRTARSKDPDAGTGLELADVEIPDVSEQLARMADAAASAGAQKQSQRQKEKEREEMYACCGIKWPQ